MMRALRGPQVDADDARPRGPEFTQRPTVADDARPLWASVCTEAG